MGDVLYFQRRRHVRASATSRAAKVANNSAVTPAEQATGVASTAFHHSAGMRSRCHHLRAAATPAPISDAMASGETQSPMTERNEVMSDMESSLGQLVLNCKAKVSHDCGPSRCQNRPVSKDAVSQYQHDFIARVRAARAARYDSQQALCDVLEIDQGLYKWYETERWLPHELIARFCLACGVTIDWLITGKGKGPAISPRPAKRQRTAAQARPRAKHA